MSPMMLTILIMLSGGLLSLVLLGKVKKLQWIIFFMSAAYLTVATLLLYGKWELAETFRTGFFNLHLANTKLGWLFLAASTIVTLLISIFSLSYNDKKHTTAIAPLWTMLLAANAGIFLAADWIAFLVFWEIMGWTSFFIIAHGKSKPFKAGIYYYALSLIGTSALLAAIFLIHKTTGTFSIAESVKLLALQWQDESSLLYTLVILLSLAFFTKSAIGPFYMWPAKAHGEAPDDFSAFLSGIMIKYGIFGMVIAVIPLFGSDYSGALVNNTPLLLYILGWIGAFTAVWGTLLAIRENDMKRLMAYSTVSNIGFIVLAMSVNTAFGIAAAVFHTFNHMVFKGAIFLSMASVKYRTGEREMHRLGGIAYRMPVAFFTFLLGIIAAAGIPPMSGFASKWMVFQALFNRKLLFLAIPAFFASTAAFMYLYRGLHAIYLGQLSPRFKNIKAAPPLQSIIMIIMMLAIFGVGAFPGLVLLPINEAVGAGSAVEGNISSIVGITSQVNLTAVAAVFMGSFLIILILYFIGKKRKLVEFMDNYMAGESPEDWDMIPEQYHYAYHFYEPFEKMFNPILDTFSFERWFANISRNISRLSGSMARLLSSHQSGAMLLTSAVVIILLSGLILW